MDCPSEESLIRLKLAGHPGITSLTFDIPNRRLEVLHTNSAEAIFAELDALKQAIKNKNEPEVPLYPDSAGLGPETPLRYIAADAVNDALKRFTSPIQKALRERFGDRDDR